MTVTPEKARQDHARDVARAREAQRNCARRFLMEAGHEEVCICDPMCSRTYDPRPYAGAEPEPPEWYEDGLGALYGVPLRPDQVAELAGWNIVRRGDDDG